MTKSTSVVSFETTIEKIYGKEGAKWLEELPGFLRDMALKYNLTELTPFPSLTYNYVASGFQKGVPVILKRSMDTAGLAREAMALRCFKDRGTVTAIAEEPGMLLLERAVPGTSLKSFFPHKDEESIQIACSLMQRLHRSAIPQNHPFPHIRDWLKALDTATCIPESSLQKAKKMRDFLLQTRGADTLLHGDLHHDNILWQGNDWVVIDPKGVIGERAFEVAAFIRNPIPELLHHVDAPNSIQGRVTRFAELLELPYQRILDWCFVQAVLAWVWAEEDQLPTTYFEKTTAILNTLEGF